MKTKGTRRFRPGTDPEAAVEEAIRRPELVGDVVRGLDDAQARVRFGCGKVLRLLAGRAPALVYPHFPALEKLFAGDNTILRWNAIAAIGDLAAVDEEGRIEAMFDRFFAPIRGQAGALIALARPRLAGRIVEKILEVECARYKTEECRNVAIGHACVALSRCLEVIEDRAPVRAFAERGLKNSRSGTRKKAENLLARLTPSASRRARTPR